MNCSPVPVFQWHGHMSSPASLTSPSTLSPLATSWFWGSESASLSLSCALESVYNSWTVNVQYSHNDLGRQLAVHDAGTYSYFMWSKMAVLRGVLKSQPCVLVSHSLIWNISKYYPSPVNIRKVKHGWVYWWYLLPLFMISLYNFSVYQTATLIDRRAFPLNNLKRI